MPRRPRIGCGGLVFHVMNRAVRHGVLFTEVNDYAAFEQVLLQALHKVPIRLLAYCAMPNHWHLIVWPAEDNQMPRFMHWLTTTHVRRWHEFHRTAGTGALYQSRYKAVPIQHDKHFLWACRYVERNALRANLVDRAELWRWSSLWRLANNCTDQVISPWPLLRPVDWVNYVNRPQSQGELDVLRSGIRWSVPVGDETWQADTASKLELAVGIPRVARPRVEPMLVG